MTQLDIETMYVLLRRAALPIQQAAVLRLPPEMQAETRTRLAQELHQMVHDVRIAADPGTVWADA